MGIDDARRRNRTAGQLGHGLRLDAVAAPPASSSSSGAPSAAKGWITRCRVHTGCPCLKRRTAGRVQSAVHGALEPVAFLLAWTRYGAECADWARHKRRSPTPEEVAAAFADLKAHGY